MNLLGAPTNLGNRPYEDNGRARLTTEGPARLRAHGIGERLGARDLGDVRAADYRDYVRAPGAIRNVDLIRDHVLAIASVLRQHDDFTLLLGGDCSVLPGAILGLGRGEPIGLVYVDAHSDFGTEETTTTGGAAGMDLAFVTGRGKSELARLGGPQPLVRDEHVVTFGVRDGSFEGSNIRRVQTSQDALAIVGDLPLFVHVDVDVLDPKYMPFVDSPEPGGVTPDELLAFLTPLVRHPRAIGLEITIYDPRHDSDGTGAKLIVDLVARAFEN